MADDRPYVEYPNTVGGYQWLSCDKQRRDLASSDTSRCGLCRFEFVTGRVYKYAYLDCLNELRMGFGVFGSDSFNTSPLCFHPGCLSMTTHLTAVQIAWSLAYTIAPTELEKEARKDWAATTATTALDDVSHVQADFRPQVSARLGSLLSREFVTAYTLLEWQNHRIENPGTIFEVSLDETIWCDAVTFEDEEYMGPLRADKARRNSEPIHVPGLPADTLYTAENHSGIISILFGTRAFPPPLAKGPGIWWRVYPLGDATSLIGQTDGIKLRSLVPNTRSRRCPIDRASGSWSPPYVIPPSLTSTYQPTFIDELAAQIMCNPIIQHSCSFGVSVSWNGCAETVHVHKGDNNTEFYNGCHLTDEPTWYYLPLHHEEAITQVWIRHPDTNSLHGPSGRVAESVGFVTSKGRTVVLGPYKPPGTSMWEPIAVSGPDNVYVTGVFGLLTFNHTPSGLQCLEFNEPRAPPNQYPSRLGSVNYSTAVVTDLAYILLCFSESGESIVGLVLGYADGNRERLGHVRLDRVDYRVDLKDNQPWYICFEFDDHGTPDIVGVYAEEPSSGSCETMIISPEGWLDWWWGDGLVRLFHNDQASPLAARNHIPTSPAEGASPFQGSSRAKRAASSELSRNQEPKCARLSTPTTEQATDPKSYELRQSANMNSLLEAAEAVLGHRQPREERKIQLRLLPKPATTLDNQLSEDSFPPSLRTQLTPRRRRGPKRSIPKGDSHK